MRKKEKISSREIGLVSALILGKYLFKTSDLHYGWWPADLAVKPENISRAQENYSNFLISHIPSGVKTILDVGCGAGELAKKLFQHGYQVEGVSPARLLSREAKKNVGEKFLIYEDKYENLQINKKYDLIIFAESFQYIDLKCALEQTNHFLDTGGYFLICDFFQTEAPGESALGGGHRLSEFNQMIKNYPFSNIKDIDITGYVAPNLQLVDEMLQTMGKPLWELLLFYLRNNHPLLTKLLEWKFRKKIEKIERKYFQGARNAENFKIYKTYRLLLYQKISTAA